jgi:hypothetical protein
MNSILSSTSASGRHRSSSLSSSAQRFVRFVARRFDLLADVGGGASAARSPSLSSSILADCRRRHRSSMLVASSDSCASPSSPSPPLSGCLRRRLLAAAGASGVNSIGLTPVDQSVSAMISIDRAAMMSLFCSLLPPLAVLVARHRAARHRAAPVSHGVRTRLDERRTADVAPFALLYSLTTNAEASAEHFHNDQHDASQKAGCQT